jgi:uncharacterized protein (TIGR00255 family)
MSAGAPMTKSALAAPGQNPSSVSSMTGFARVSGRVSDTLGFTLSLKSVNHRFLDLHLRLPSGTESLEMELRRVLKEKLSRGHVEVTLNLDRSQKADTTYDAAQVALYLDAFRSAAEKHHLSGEPDLNLIFRLPGIFNGERGEGRGTERGSEEEVQSLEGAVLRELPSLIEALNAMRAREGGVLAAELRSGLDRLQVLVDEAAALRGDVQQAYFERIAQRLKSMLNGSFDPERVLQEAAILAERSDVEEEITRLRTHIGHFRSARPIRCCPKRAELPEMVLASPNSVWELNRRSRKRANRFRISNRHGQAPTVNRLQGEDQRFGRHFISHFGALRFGQVHTRQPASFAGRESRVFRFLHHAATARIGTGSSRISFHFARRVSEDDRRG